MKKITLIVLIMLFYSPLIFSNSIIPSEFEVKGTAKKIIMFRDGETADSGKGDQVVYWVDRTNKIITRKAILNSNVKGGALAGLQADNTQYSIVYDDLDLITNKWIIKGIGQAGVSDGFETVVIDEKNIITSNSKFDYFMLYYYERTDLLATNS